MKSQSQRKSGLRKRRKTVLFVDDDLAVQRYTSRIARRFNLRKRGALNPARANAIINLRLRAIEHLRNRLAQKLQSAKTPAEKKDLAKRISTLNELQKKPFAMVVSDVNMPRGHSTGVKFVQNLRAKLPEQRILMHSDDLNALDYLMEKGFEREIKIPGSGEEELKERLKSELWPKKYPRKKTDDDWF